MDGVQQSQGYRATIRRQFTLIPLSPSTQFIVLGKMKGWMKLEAT